MCVVCTLIFIIAFIGFVTVPPKLEKPCLKKVVGGEMKWVKAGEQLPPGALIGGYENEILYIIRAQHRGSLTPGKFIPSQGMGFIPWGGDNNETSDFEVRTSIFN